jgi:predicted PurR-regulated permease PerM
MATIYFLLGALTVVVLVTVAGVFKMSSDLDRKISNEINSRIEKIWKKMSDLENDAQKRDGEILDNMVENKNEIHEELHSRHQDLLKQLDSRCDKLWHQVNSNYELVQSRINDLSKKNSSTEG